MVPAKCAVTGTVHVRTLVLLGVILIYKAVPAKIDATANEGVARRRTILPVIPDRVADHRTAIDIEAADAAAGRFPVAGDGVAGYRVAV